MTSVCQADGIGTAHRDRIERVLTDCLTLPGGSTDRLIESMRYSTLAGGKRLRPVLVYVTGTALGASLEVLDAPAAAVELIHVYSLVHDDLPAMDNDDLRRGRPTCHRAYDEATAVLVGDALQALAFEVLVQEGPGAAPAAKRLAMAQILARAIGTSGMAGGQAIDLAAVGRKLGAAELEHMHRLKTGALIHASVMLGVVSADVTTTAAYQVLSNFGRELGLAFQIQDDILDVEGQTDQLGKRVGADAALEKPTYPSVFGLEEARRLALAARDRAIATLAPLGDQGEPLRQLAQFVVSRFS
ncbi:MAG: polyprenyl synthetase family protein [Proteobacteria bacterium]|nr:polyprenyl synthetase family protein [Pseudomonadota bacterium]